MPLLDCKIMMVDEFQDVCAHQLKLVLLHGLNNIVVTTVSDDDQAIFSFRASLGAKAILSFERALNAKRIVLSQNYRSYSEILSAAYKVVERNRDRVAKSVEAVRGEGGVVKIAQFDTPVHEAVFIANEISATPLLKTYIIARTNAYLMTVESILTERGIAFKKQQSKGYFDTSICHLAMSASVSLFNNRGQELNHLLKVLCASDLSISRQELLNQPMPTKGIPEDLTQALGAIKGSHERYGAGDSKTAIKMFFSGIAPRLLALKYSDAPRLHPLAETLNKMKAPTLAAKITLLSTPQKNKDADALVTLMTMHASKGLEAPRVFVAGVNQGVIPSAKALKEAGITGAYRALIDGESRLVFVAVTRAEDVVYITCAEGTDSRPKQYGPSYIIKPLTADLKL
jgi:DNA helicase-2/ATP-dependent DNA helicase PcrA